MGNELGDYLWALTSWARQQETPASVEAEMHFRCAMRRNHRIAPGERIGFIEGIGWCCSACTTSEREACA